MTTAYDADELFVPRGYDDNEFARDLLAQADAEADFASAAERTVAGGRCTLCEADAPELLPWSGERACWPCVDLQLDLLAKAIMDAGAVPVVLAVA